MKQTLPIAFPTSLLIFAATFLLPLPLTPRSLLRGCPALLPIVLLHYGVTRLVTVVLAVNHMLLLQLWIPIP